jgi:hypothetical protein
LEVVSVVEGEAEGIECRGVLRSEEFLGCGELFAVLS